MVSAHALACNALLLLRFYSSTRSPRLLVGWFSVCYKLQLDNRTTPGRNGVAPDRSWDKGPSYAAFAKHIILNLSQNPTPVTWIVDHEAKPYQDRAGLGLHLQVGLSLGMP